MDRKSLIISMGVGVAGAAVVGGALYAFLSLNDKESFKEVATRPITTEIKIKAGDAGAVIGKSGTNIRSIESKTNTHINFRSEKDTSTERFIAITGSPDDVKIANILINQSIKNQIQIESAEMLVPSDVIGFIIGYKGENIKNIEYETNCRIRASREEFKDNKRKIYIKGESLNIFQAKNRIQRIIKEKKDKDEKKSDTPAGQLEYNQPLFLTSENNDNSTLISKHPQGFTEDLQKVPGSSTIGVFVAAMDSPSHFFVQKSGAQAVELDKLVEEMTNFYQLEINQKLHSLNEAVVGDIVVSEWSRDRQWYRARVVDVIVDEYDESKIQVDLDFVDFGDTDRKPLNEVFKIKQDFLKLGFQAILCSLAYVKPTNGHEWSEESCEYFDKISKCGKWKEIQAEIVESLENGETNIVLTDHSGPEPTDLGQELIGKGYASFVGSITTSETTDTNIE